MLLNKDGTYIRDIDIEELSISYGEDFGGTITLTREKITHRNSITPTVAELYFPKGYFDAHEIPITKEQFEQLSEAIHNVGLCGLFQKSASDIDSDMAPGRVFQTLWCRFTDGAEYAYATYLTPEKEFDDIFQILLPFIPLTDMDEVFNPPQIRLLGNKYFKTNCCNATVLDSWSHCPKCGRALETADMRETAEKIDPDEPIWRCEGCYEGMPLYDGYCGKCGRRKHFNSPLSDEDREIVKEILERKRNDVSDRQKYKMRKPPEKKGILK